MFDLKSGQIVADKYRIDGVIGAGGMGVVVGATHLELDQHVAIKFLRDASEEALARFQREARLIVRLKSVHVARVFDIGSLDDDTPFIVMERLEGEDLSKVLDKRGGHLPVETAIDYVLEACEAVAEAHTLGMVHRDLKPANLFLARGPGGSASVKVLDFGISKNLDDRISEGTSGGLTNEGSILGSPGYMSPEQMNSSRDVDARSDIYSLGAILYRLCGGKNPYKGDSLVSVMASMAMEPLVPLHEIAQGIPAGFATAVERCLAQEPQNRFATVADLAQAIAKFGSRRAKASAEQIVATMSGLASNANTMTSVQPGSVSSSTTNAAVVVSSAPAARAKTPSRGGGGNSPDATLLSATPSSGSNAIGAMAGGMGGGMGEMSVSATEPLGATIVSPLSIPSSPSYPPHQMQVQSAPSYPLLLDRSQTAPDARKRSAAAMRTNIFAAMLGVALVLGVVVWSSSRRTTPVRPADESAGNIAQPIDSTVPTVTAAATTLIPSAATTTTPSSASVVPSASASVRRPKHGNHGGPPVVPTDRR